MDDPLVDYLDLADWRRRMTELYSRVRVMAGNPQEAHRHWQQVRERLYREHPASPVPQEKRAAFRAMHFQYEPALRFELPLITERAAEAAPAAEVNPFGIELPISTGQPRSFERAGWVEFSLNSESRRLEVMWLPEYSGGLFLAFRDATNGRETYGGGRYILDTAKGADLGGDPERRILIVDFNFSYQPSCAFDPRWSCPLSAQSNRLDIEIRAGERIS